MAQMAKDRMERNRSTTGPDSGDTCSSFSRTLSFFPMQVLACDGVAMKRELQEIQTGRWSIPAVFHIREPMVRESSMRYSMVIAMELYGVWQKLTCRSDRAGSIIPPKMIAYDL